LEQRVKTLEYEIKILKNEVQRTLLDIQEQILVHYYPTLRADNEGPSEGTIQSIEEIREKKRQLGGDERQAQSQPSSSRNATVKAHAGAGNPMKEVTLDEARAMKASPDGGDGQSEGSSDGPSMEEIEGKEQDEMVILSGWVSSTAKRIGKDPTSKLVRSYIEQDILSPHVEQPLLRLVGLIDQSDTPDNVAVNDILRAVMKLDELLGRNSDIDEALSVIEQAGLG
jgi:hypothetical protein